MLLLSFQDYDWPMEGYLLPNAPKLHKKQDSDSGCKSGVSKITELRIWLEREQWTVSLYLSVSMYIDRHLNSCHKFFLNEDKFTDSVADLSKQCGKEN